MCASGVSGMALRTSHAESRERLHRLVVRAAPGVGAEGRRRAPAARGRWAARRPGRRPPDASSRGSCSNPVGGARRPASAGDAVPTSAAASRTRTTRAPSRTMRRRQADRGTSRRPRRTRIAARCASPRTSGSRRTGSNLCTLRSGARARPGRVQRTGQEPVDGGEMPQRRPAPYRPAPRAPARCARGGPRRVSATSPADRESHRAGDREDVVDQGPAGRPVGARRRPRGRRPSAPSPAGPRARPVGAVVVRAVSM